MSTALHPLATSAQAATSVPVLRPYDPCDTEEAAALCGLPLKTFDHRRLKATIWYELGGTAAPIAAGRRPKGRQAGALPLVGVALPYLGICLPGAHWVFDRVAVRAAATNPVQTLSLVSVGAPSLLEVAERMAQLLEQAR
jgi:hypothetical protein